MKHKIKFGPSQVMNPTPAWVKITFRIIVLLSAAATTIIANTHLMSDAAKVEVNVWLAGLNVLTLGISQMFGIEYPKPTAAAAARKRAAAKKSTSTKKR